MVTKAKPLTSELLARCFNSGPAHGSVLGAESDVAVVLFLEPELAVERNSLLLPGKPVALDELANIRRGKASFVFYEPHFF